MRRPLIVPVFALLLVAVFVSGCTSRKVDLQKSLKVTDVTTGWFDAGIQEGGKNKLVPSISFKLQNADSEALASVQVLGKFNLVNDPQELGSSYIRGIGSDGLPPGQSTGPFVMQSSFGFTGEQPRAIMLQHTQFQDAEVELFGKYKADSYVSLGKFKIARQLLTR